MPKIRPSAEQIADTSFTVEYERQAILLGVPAAELPAHVPAGAIPTMTVHELELRLRALGMGLGRKALELAIEQGVFPFAQRIEPDGERIKSPVYIVYTRLFDEWAAERCNTPTAAGVG